MVLKAAKARVLPQFIKTGRTMFRKRLPIRDPRTVAREIPGVLDILFPRLGGRLVASLNKIAFKFVTVEALSDTAIESSRLQHSMLFELSMARAESLLGDGPGLDWRECLLIAIGRQRRHFDAEIPSELTQSDIALAEWTAQNLVGMLKNVMEQHPQHRLLSSPVIPGLGWISSGNGDFSLGPILIEVKHTDRNFVAADFRQVLMYWILKYAASLERDQAIWSNCLLLNPRRNSAVLVNFDYLLRSASAGLNRLEVLELMRSVVGGDTDRTQ